MIYEIQIHFENKGQYSFLYEPDSNEHINDYLLRFDEPKEKFLLTGDEESTALINMQHVCAIIAKEFHEPSKEL
jgi:hypothetical protein